MQRRRGPWPRASASSNTYALLGQRHVADEGPIRRSDEHMLVGSADVSAIHVGRHRAVGHELPCARHGLDEERLSMPPIVRDPLRHHSA